MKHIVTIPYYSEDEVRRYLRIAELLTWLKSANTTALEFLICPAPSIRLSDRLLQAFSTVSAVSVYQCTTGVVGYPQRATAMFWEIMEYIASAYPRDGGFVLWLESDMVPIRSNWAQKLISEWTSTPNVLLMGPWMPEFRTRKGDIVPEHINGGSCYSKDLVKHVPIEARRAYFDLELFSYVKKTNRFKPSDLFVLASYHELPDLIFASKAVILHGYLQSKDKFVKRCADLVEQPESLQRKMSWFSKATRLPILRRCCKHGYRKGVYFVCPVHRNEALARDYQELMAGS
jgi:hypothetical protein